MTIYKVPQQEIQFILEHLINYSELCKMPGYEEASEDMVAAILPEAAKFFEQIVAPTNWPSNTQPAYLQNNQVITSPALDGVYQQMVEAGWCSLSGATEFGGAGFPVVIDAVVQEMLQSSNVGFSLLPTLTRGVIHALNLYGSEPQKQRYLQQLISGNWSGTMNLTEPQAGSDLSAVKTKAVPAGDHYLITGQKIYITWGDHEQAENIIHLVLARLPDAPEGNQGISLFLVPKFLINEDGSLGDRNDVTAVGVEHKLGIHSSPTCTLAFGDKAGAVGYLVGPLNQGLMCMFSMMNHARLAVGHQGVAVGERSYQQALDYASQRIQGAVQGVEGRAPIVHHPDVKRMLLQMRALTEAGRAMSLVTMAAEDRATHHPQPEVRAQNALHVEVMTPLVKGWCTEMAMETTSLGVQVHGGMGFIEETGAAQHMRDARILPIYEGTNGIQALDFIGRKCLRDHGEGIRQLLADMSQTIDINTNQTEPSKLLLAGLQVTLDQCQSALDHVLAHPQKASFVAYQFMMLFGNSVAYWQLAILGCAAAEKIQSGDQDEFLKQKLATAQFYKTQILPRNQSHLAAILADSEFIDNLMLN
ncbi:acyl-CoA dehydrogenase family protein [Porticoccaceae bacterium]|nr:acyl-CoA dehydrogenase family protein [Porticoccaceae bacterium]MDA8898829.1 acyl-CoA dehydrogenase family protein [Porticoccaceae bacterium]